jgi:hypothetical protein
MVLLMLLLAVVMFTASGSTWKLHNYYMAGKIENVVDAGKVVYYLNGGRLYRFDKSTLETVSLTRENVLSDHQISQLYYDWERELLFVAYANSNIDVIDANGKVVNVSGIKDVLVTVHDYTVQAAELVDYVGKDIRDITFGGGKAYVAMGYGYAVIDESTFTIVKEVKVRNTVCINSVALVGSRLVIISNNNTYWGNPASDDPVGTYERKSTSYGKGARMMPVNDHAVLVTSSSKFYNCDFASGSPVVTILLNASATCVQKSPSGFIANFAGQPYYYTVDATGRTVTKHGTAAGFASSDPHGDGTVWINDASGLHIEGSSTSYKVNSLTTDQPYWLKYNAAMNVLYVANTGAIFGISPATSVTNVINTFDGLNWSDATAYPAAGGAYGFEFSPLDPTTYVRASWTKGIHKVTNNVLVTNYTKNNAKIAGTKPTPTFDNYGNLWVVSSYFSSSEQGSGIPSVAVLPAAKFAKATANKNDWIAPAGLQTIYTGSIQRSRFLVSKKNNYKIFIDGDFPENQTKGAFLCWDNGSEDPSIDNYRISAIAHMIDQNDRQVQWKYINHMEQDRDGNIWVGHSQGVFMFDPDVVFDEQPRAVRPFVTRSVEGRGTLCEGYSVYDIGVDSDNNKWLATDDGVYFISPDGSEVYQHFTTEGSDLPSNLVYSVECDTVNGRVYVYTDNGFAEYIANGEAAALDFSGAYAFPNPVEPDFTGLVKIAGLMENTYITIADSDGRIVAQMGPVMGTTLWDTCGPDRLPVPEGLYRIYAAQGSSPAASGTPLMTLLVIR